MDNRKLVVYHNKIVINNYNIGDIPELEKLFDIYDKTTFSFKSIGVVYDRNREKWMARIVLNKKDIYLGRYSNKEDAIKARLEAEIKYFGEFAPQRHLFEQYGININGSDIDIQSERWNEENSDEN